MIANDLSLFELVNFSDGEISLQGRRLIIHDIHAIAELRRDLLKMTGPDQARQILTRFGYWWGKADAAAMKRIFKWDSLEELLRSGPRLQTLAGAAKAVVKSINIGENPDQFRMEVLWHNSVEVQEQLIAFGPSKSPSCWILTGYASGFASYCMKRDIYFIENQCKAEKGIACSAVGMTKEAWGTQIEPHLRFFELDDIQSRVETLSRDLLERTRLLDEQRRKAASLQKISNTANQEIRSVSYLRVIDIAERVAPYDSSILITGETGTGKEVLANRIHSISGRSARLFLPINCGALPESLLESELFGHTAGAFTGANHERAGIFEEANGGTVFLDEIGDISPALQVKLLRVLQEHQIVRLGENRPRDVDVRIMAATNRDLVSLIKERKFREDLYYRLAVVELNIPPLRERIEDILPLARHFVKKFSRKLRIADLRLDASCLDFLQSYKWPGNIRELENAIERAALLCSGGVIRPENLPSAIVMSKDDFSLLEGTTTLSLKDLEMRHISRVLQMTNGNQRKACEILGIGQATLWRKMKQERLIPD